MLDGFENLTDFGTDPTVSRCVDENDLSLEICVFLMVKKESITIKPVFV